MTGSRHNFERIVKEYSAPLYWHIRRLVVSHDDAEDILQDTFVKAYRRLWQLRSFSSLKPWLYRIATNECNDFLSKRCRTEAVPLEQALLSSLSVSEDVDYTKQAEIALQKALLQLSPQQRTVFNLRYYDEMDYDQMAIITGSKPDTLRVAYHNAKDKIKRYLDNE